MIEKSFEKIFDWRYILTVFFANPLSSIFREFAPTSTKASTPNPSSASRAIPSTQIANHLPLLGRFAFEYDYLEKESKTKIIGNTIPIVNLK